MCSYNGERCIAKAIEDILKQECYGQLVEDFILVNNHSDDATQKIMESFADREAIRLLYEEKPGLSNARLCGVGKARGSWVVFIDDDNYLRKDWLIQAKAYIERSDQQLGVFGGSIIPVLRFQKSQETEAILHNIYSSLAITHLHEEEIDHLANKHPINTPYGAGMVIRKEIVEKLVRNGWLKLQGRTGNNLNSGEDTEICRFAQASGYWLGYQPEMLLEHDIPKYRLTLEYAKKLMEGIYQGVYDLSGRDMLWILRRLSYVQRMIKNEFFCLRHQKCGQIEKRIDVELKRVYNRVMYRNLKRDCLIMRRI